MAAQSNYNARYLILIHILPYFRFFFNEIGSIRLGNDLLIYKNIHLFIICSRKTSKTSKNRAGFPLDFFNQILNFVEFFNENQRCLFT